MKTILRFLPSRRLLCFLIAAALAIPAAAAAYRVTPMRMELPAEPGAQGSYVVVNTQEKTIAVQALIFEQTQEEGEARLTPREQDFIVVPPQMVLEPGDRQTVRVQWIADRPVERELSYRVKFEQVPVPMPAKDGGDVVEGALGVAYAYSTAVYIVPDGAEAKLDVVSFEPVQANDGKKYLQLTVRNSGTKRGNVLEPTLLLTSRASGQSVVLEGDEIGKLHGGLLLAGATVTAYVPWPESLPFGPVDATLDAKMTIV